ncbi:hypothetical protein SBA4_3200036 [Candidatus Sulfopaludibacter sp. SbA4]|nr:hypothetical protein SBA4_3200036 [Candidatus Sulfopaludibacter sp. SbA4]
MLIIHSTKSAGWVVNLQSLAIFLDLYCIVKQKWAIYETRLFDQSRFAPVGVRSGKTWHGLGARPAAGLWKWVMKRNGGDDGVRTRDPRRDGPKAR